MREAHRPIARFTRVNALTGGDRFAVVLEFKFLSGKMVGVQSMAKSVSVAVS